MGGERAMATDLCETVGGGVGWGGRGLFSLLINTDYCSNQSFSPKTEEDADHSFHQLNCILNVSQRKQ